jgi:UDP-N-acetylglucosamine 2-epimerase (non-hydrolysing)
MAHELPRIGVVLGTRPEVVKNWSVVAAARRRGVHVEVLHTHQHADPAMLGVFFEQLGYAPDAVLPGSYSIGRAIDWVGERVRANGLDLVLSNGDTAASLVAAVAALYADVAYAHVEAGLRSGDVHMVEERNRIMVDAVAHHLFAYTELEAGHLRAQSTLRGRIVVVGNTTNDVLRTCEARLVRPRRDSYAYVTMHRKEFTDDRDAMEEVFAAFRALASQFEAVVFPMHPRTRDAMRRHAIEEGALSGVTVIAPVPLFESLALAKHAEVILTDSGCLQEEAYLLGVPCVTVRDNTERHGTLSAGANVVAGLKLPGILAAVAQQRRMRGTPFPPIYGGPGVGDRILDELLASHASSRRTGPGSRDQARCESR